MHLFCAVFEKQLLKKSQIFPIPHLYMAPKQYLSQQKNEIPWRFLWCLLVICSITHF